MIPLRYLITHLASYQVTQNGNRETIVVSDKNRCHKGQKIKNYSIIPYHDREGYETAKPDQGSVIMAGTPWPTGIPHTAMEMFSLLHLHCLMGQF